MRSFRRVLAVAAAGALLLVPGLAAAQQAARVSVEVMVSYISPRAGAVDPRAERLHELLRKDFAYKSLRVLHMQRLSLNPDQHRSLTLPNGRQFKIRPILVDERGVLAAIEVGRFQTDQRLYRRKLWIYGGERYEDGRLVISLEAYY